MPVSSMQLVDLYPRRAKHCDFTAQFHYLAAYRRKAV